MEIEWDINDWMIEINILEDQIISLKRQIHRINHDPETDYTKQDREAIWTIIEEKEKRINQIKSTKVSITFDY